VRLFQVGRRRPRRTGLPDPMVSDELEFVKLVDPAKPGKSIVLEGDWKVKEGPQIPWYFDNLLMGKPGARLTFTFEGTAVALFGLMYNNGLKVEAELDGQPIAGCYLRHFIEFGKGTMLAHGLPSGKHELKLVVGEASRRHNKLNNPTAQIAFLGIAQKPDPAAKKVQED
jgi:hypothetical protein